MIVESWLLPAAACFDFAGRGMKVEAIRVRGAKRIAVEREKEQAGARGLGVSE